MSDRYYRPYLNQWIQPDPIVPQLRNPQTLNRYAYVNNNPVNYTDPSGYTPWPAQNIKALQALQPYIVASAKRHNNFVNSRLTNEAFAALMAAYLNRERRLAGTNLWDLTDVGRSIFIDPEGDAAGFFGYNASTGIANIRPSVGIEILTGELDVFPHKGHYEVCGSNYAEAIRRNTRYIEGVLVTPGDQDPVLRRLVFSELQNPF